MKHLNVTTDSNLALDEAIFLNYGYKMLISAIALLIMHKVSIKVKIRGVSKFYPIPLNSTSVSFLH